MTVLNLFSDISKTKKIRIGYQGSDSSLDKVYFENGYIFNANNISDYATAFSDDPANAAAKASSVLVNKRYVDNLTSGITYIESVDFASDTNVSLYNNNTDLSGFVLAINSTMTSDSIDTIVHNSRILLRNQTVSSENGIYTVNLSEGTYTLDNSNNDGVLWNLYHGIVDASGNLQKGIYVFNKHNSTSYISYCSINTLDTTHVCFTEYSSSNSNLNPGTGLHKNYNNIDGFTFDIKSTQLGIKQITSDTTFGIDSTQNMTLNTAAKIDIDAANIDLTATTLLNIDAATIDISGTSTVDINSSGTMSLISYADLSLNATALLNVDAANIDLTAVSALDIDAASIDLTASALLNIDAANIDLTAVSALDIDAATVDISGTSTVDINSSGTMSLISYADLSLNATALLNVDAANIDLTAVSSLDIDATALDIDATYVDISGTSTVDINSSGTMGITTYGGDLTLTSSTNMEITTTSTIDMNANILDIDATTISIDGTTTMTGVTNIIGNTNITLGVGKVFNINSTKFSVDESGNCDMAAGTLTVSEIKGVSTFSDSDRRLKDNIDNIPLGLNFIDNLQPKMYNYNHIENKNTHFGLIAQDVIGLLDENNIDHKTTSLVGTNNNMYSLNYTEFIPILMNSIKELKSQVESLKTEVDILKTK